jgi:dnd system-associated protein 4
MADYMTGRDTIGIEKSVHEIYKQLTEGNNPTDSPFKSMKDVFMWAAVVGFQNGEPLSIDGKREVVFRWAQLSPQTDIPLLKAMAIATGKEFDVLLDRDTILTIAEEYANAGIREIQQELLGQSGQPLWNLVSLIKS